MARKQAPAVEYVRHTGGPAWGVGVLVAQNREQRTYLFADGVKRSFKEAFCERFIVPAEPPSDEDRTRLARGLTAGGTATPKAVNLELEAEIRQRPDDPAPYLVYADWLQNRGDPRGDLITIQHRLAADPTDRQLRRAEGSLLDAHSGYLLPKAFDALIRSPRRAGEDPYMRCETTWFLGFLQRVRIARKPSQKDIELPALVSELLRHPSAVFLRSLVLGPLGLPEETSYIELLDAIAHNLPPLMEELVLGDFAPGTALDFTLTGDLSPVLSNMPQLQRLTVRAGRVRFDRVPKHERLRELRVAVSEMSEANERKLFGMQLPALERLEIEYPGLDGAIVPLKKLLDGKRLPRLAHLALRGTVSTRQVLDTIAMSPAMPKLETLALERGDLRDGDADYIVKLRGDRLAHLGFLSLAENPLSTAAALQLSRLTGKVDARPAAPARGPVTERAVVERAPDAKSMIAARKLAHPDKWMVVARDHQRLWGEYDGSDNYYVWARLDTDDTGCNCGSPKDPCKHVLALLLIAAHGHALVERAIPAAFVRRSYERPRYTPAWE
ncbi:MAG TPA: TIGR02996 domain-containing protein [Kofleriaceae bacterium]|nr:TIGR02996 domain-containing protein [Kofleriaceae bacterium]